ncbi:MAG: response regulator [Prolixibacteraceae bacterium]|nr:response regulator [Prolixibacteraceae bacterium]
MKIRDISIGTQLKAGFGIIVFLIIVLGVFTWEQNRKLALQTHEMYEHPFKVQKALGELKANILIIHRGMKDLFLTGNEEEFSQVIQGIERAKQDVSSKLDIIYSAYLGPKSDIDSIYYHFVTWNAMREETIRLFRAGQVELAAARTKSATGIAGKQAEKISACVQKAYDFADNKAGEFYREATEKKYNLRITALIVISLVIILTSIVITVLIFNIKRPLSELDSVIRQLIHGQTGARVNYTSKNIFGALASGFNSMADTIESDLKLKSSTAKLAETMLSEEDARRFSQKLLGALLQETGSQMGAVYFLNKKNNIFENFECIGMDRESSKNFSADEFEGQIGLALASGKIQYVTDIPGDTPFKFYTANGYFMPREIVTLPIVSGKKTIALVSLASVKNFTPFAQKLLQGIFPMLNARINGVLVHHKVILFSEELEEKNRELDMQKKELSVQADELMEQNTELEFQKQQLDEASRLKTNFLSNMSHELRTPLNSVIALSGVLNRRLKGKIAEEEYSYIDVIERNGKHLLSLINDILDISRIEAGREEIEISRFDVNQLIAEIVEMIQPQARLKKISLAHLENNAEILIGSDVKKCRHILQNLISNAVKFTDKGRVEVLASQKNGELEIVVKDTGIGIDETHLPYIFDEFRQADSSTARRFGGTGLGLAIVKKLTNLLGGRVLVDSVPGKGSVFTLILPLGYNSENIDIPLINRGEKSKPVSDKPEDVSGKTILLIEDSEPAIIQVKDVLDEAGYQVMVARNGEEALERIGGAITIPDAIILDLMMPGTDGFEVLQIVRENQRTAHIPILILTAKHITKEELSFLKKNNIYQLIQKGDVNLNELMETVNSMVFPEKPAPLKIKTTTAEIKTMATALIVEDNPDNMLTVKAILGDKFNVIEAYNGKQGVEMARAHIPDVIFMDIELPEMDGIQAFKAIRTNRELEHIPVIALTASATTSDRESILAHGFDAYIPKPINEKLFFNIIDQILYGK